MGRFGVVDVQQVVGISLAAAEGSVTGKFVVVESIGIAQVELGESVAAKGFVPGKGKNAGRIQTIRLVSNLYRSNDGVVGLQVIFCVYVLYKRPVDKEQFYGCGYGEDARLGGDGTLPLAGEQGHSGDHQYQDESGNHLACGHGHGDFVQGFEVGSGNGVVQQILTAHKEQTD